ncbi:hypothetical protein BLA29_002854 [Euroglyphus maynei]|uniref:Uncharacterized protein n=1 Tax=Euroglyphus maynei TaxID=6958 RepID=A0A1Y3AR25_EURMA|nr:hypothetical protein BLA29_002854 [Euroglyphus maynei]
MAENNHPQATNYRQQQQQIGHRQQQQQLVAGALFTNGTYSQFDFDQPPKHTDPNQVNVKIIQNQNNNSNNRLIYPPELNYVNSVTALKEQIARAKANFFKEPQQPSPST